MTNRIEPRRQLGLLAKYWQPGQVKTRLAAEIGAAKAAQLHRIFVETLLARFADLPAERVLCYSPSDRRNEFAGLASGSSWQLQPQYEGDLGARMQRYFQTSFARGCPAAVLIGSDSPTLPRDYVLAAFERLADAPVVLGRAEDGGYYLIGLRPPLPPIFENMPWSTANVFAETVARLQSAAIDHATLPSWYDVDDLATLRRLRTDLLRLVTSPHRNDLQSAIRNPRGTRYSGSEINSPPALLCPTDELPHWQRLSAVVENLFASSALPNS